MTTLERYNELAIKRKALIREASKIRNMMSVLEAELLSNYNPKYRASCGMYAVSNNGYCKGVFWNYSMGTFCITDHPLTDHLEQDCGRKCSFADVEDKIAYLRKSDFTEVSID